MTIVQNQQRTFFINCARKKNEKNEIAAKKRRQNTNKLTLIDVETANKQKKLQSKRKQNKQTKKIAIKTKTKQSNKKDCSRDENKTIKQRK